MSGWVTFKVSGIRVIKGSRAKLEAFASVYNLASAIKYRGGSLALNCAISASQRALNTTVSDAWPSQLWLRNGTPPSWDTLHAHTAGFQSGRCSLAEPWVIAMAWVSVSGTYAPVREKLVVSRQGNCRATSSCWHTASATSLHNVSQP